MPIVIAPVVVRSKERPPKTIQSCTSCGAEPASRTNELTLEENVNLPEEPANVASNALACVRLTVAAFSWRMAPPFHDLARAASACDQSECACADIYIAVERQLAGRRDDEIVSGDINHAGQRNIRT